MTEDRRRKPPVTPPDAGELPTISLEETPEDKLHELGWRLNDLTRLRNGMIEALERIPDAEVLVMGKMYRDREGQLYRIERVVVEGFVEVYDFNTGESTMREVQEAADWQARELVLVEHSEQGVVIPDSRAADSIMKEMRERMEKECRKAAHYDAYIQFTRAALIELRQQLAQLPDESDEFKNINQKIIGTEIELAAMERLRKEAQASGELENGDYCRDEEGWVMDQVKTGEEAEKLGREVWERVERELNRGIIWEEDRDRQWYDRMIKSWGVGIRVRQRAVERLRKQLEGRDDVAGRMILEEQLRYQETFLNYFNGVVRTLEAQFRQNLPQIEAAEKEDRKKRAALKRRQELFNKMTPEIFFNAIEDTENGTILPVENNLEIIDKELKELGERINKLPRKQKGELKKVWDDLANRLWGTESGGGLFKKKKRQGGIKLEIEQEIIVFKEIRNKIVELYPRPLAYQDGAEDEDLMRFNSEDLEELNKILEEAQNRHEKWDNLWSRLVDQLDEIAGKLTDLKENVIPPRKEPTPENEVITGGELVNDEETGTFDDDDDYEI